MATLTATPEPGFHPPRVRLDLDSGDPAQTFTAIRVRRNGVLLREQPFTGGSTATVYDYETPRGEVVSYTAEVDYATWTTRRDETWADLTGWTTVAGTPSVAGGLLSLGGAFAEVTRTLSTSYPARLTIPDVSLWESTVLFGFGNLAIESNTDRLRIRYGATAEGGPTWLSPSLTGPVSLLMTAENVTLSWSGGTRVYPMDATGHVAAADGIRILKNSPSTLARTVGQFLLEGAEVVTESLSATATLAVTAVWLVNPVAPTVSMPIDSGDCSHGDDMLTMLWPSASERVSEDLRNVHTPIGRTRAVVITTGPRMDYEWDLIVQSPTFALTRAMKDLLYNQSPLLLLIPPGFDHDIDGGWYSVGRVSISRQDAAVVYKPVTFTLPLTPIDPPAVQQGAVRTWGDVLSEAATWADLMDLYPTWADVLVGP